MTLHSELVASGHGWWVRDIVCGAGPADRPFEERHDSVCLAAVLGGTFQYRSDRGAGLLVPGAVLLGNVDSPFECSHDHGTGDRCLSFHFSADYWEGLIRSLPDVRRADLTRPRLPPEAALLPVTAALAAAREGASDALEEGALTFAAQVIGLLTDRADADGWTREPRQRDLARITDVVRHIEATAGRDGDADLSLGTLAARAHMSPYHFLRTFRRLVGTTPYRFVLRTRLARAAQALRRGSEPIAAVALAAGFDDLSTFNRRFRREFGITPGRWRHRL
ncbi:MAG TPA: AraC family transcriptional regulator [Pseudomonadales bacterium]